MKLIWMIIPMLALEFFGVYESFAQKIIPSVNSSIPQQDLNVMVENWMQDFQM